MSELGRPPWWTREQFRNEGIKDADHARQLIHKMFGDAQQLYPMETATSLRKIIAEKLGVSVRTVLNWTR